MYERQVETRRKQLKEIHVNLDKQKIESNSGGQKRDKNRYRWIDEDQAEKKNGVERDRNQPGLTKRYKEKEVDRQEIDTNIGGYTTNRLR